MNDFVINCANNQVVKVDIPNLTITSIPSLLVDQVDVTFDMEVNEIDIESNQKNDEEVDLAESEKKI